MQFLRIATLVVATLVVCLPAVSADEAEKPLRFAYPPPSETGYSVVLPIRADQLVIKLTEQEAAKATVLPEYGLPEGLPRLEALMSESGVADGRRMVLEHGLPVKDPDRFEKIGLHRTYVLRLAEPQGEAKIWKIVREFARQPWVEYAEPVYLLEPTAVPNDAEFDVQWAHLNTGQTVQGNPGTPDADADTDLAWDTQVGSIAHIVAVLDTGADLDHPDLVDNLVQGYDFINDDPFPDDTQGHGTGASGIAAARGDNGIGVAGVCWRCGLMPLTVSDSVHEADAMRFAADNGADSYNMSHTFGAAWIQGIIDATEYATSLGALGFASATNFNGYNIGTPAAYPEVVPVGGSNNNDVRVYSYNDVTELTAPGPSTRSTGLGGGYTYFGGTSSSSPFAAGMAALLRAEDPGLHVRELRHVLRLSCDDEVGIPAEDTPGWDQFMGYGRVNVDKAMQMIGGPWLGLDRPHYVCGGELTVALKDTTAGGSVQVTLTGDVGGDVETVTVTPVAGATGYYEGTIPLSWAGQDGPVVLSDGKLDVEHAENVDAAVGSLSATTFMDCMKKVCQWEELGLHITGDCDADRALDPGELWTVSPAVVVIQTEEMFDVKATLTTSNPDVTILKDSASFNDVPPFTGGHAGVADAFRIQLAPGAPANQIVDFQIAISGLGFQGDQELCLAEEGWGDTFSVRGHRDIGTQIQVWDFDDATPMGFKTEASHGMSELSECDGTWTNEWGSLPATDRSHSGAHAMRLGDGSGYPDSVDGALKSTPLTVPAGGGAISFHLWMDSFINDQFRTWDGLIVEAKRIADTTWTYVDDATYDSKLIQDVCSDGSTKVPFGYAETVEMYSGDGTGTEVVGDTFDVQHQADLTQFAGELIQVRWRFGAHDFNDPATHGTGAWVDTVGLHEAWTADSWPGDAPQNLQGDDAGCPASFDLSWDPVAGAGGYEIYRSELSCADALASLQLHDTSAGPPYSDGSVVDGTTYYYAVAATEASKGCPTVRSCIQGGCEACAPPPSPSGLTAQLEGNDVLLSWSGSAPSGPTWNVYRDPNRDPSTWGLPHASGLTDQDPGTPGIQYRDVGGVNAGTLQHYLITEVTCAESPLR